VRARASTTRAPATAVDMAIDSIIGSKDALE